MKESVNRQILRLSIPAIVSNITVPMLGLCDTAISGHLGSEIYLAAIAVGSMTLNVIFWLFGFLRMGTTGLTAVAYGAGDKDSARRIFTMSLVTALMAGIVLIILQGILLKGIGTIVGAERDVQGLVEKYFSICIWEAPALLSTMAVSGWFVGMQNTSIPMAIAIGVNLVNIAASVLYVFCLGMGFEGIAFGTLTANWVGFAISLLAAWRFSKGERLMCNLREAFAGGSLRRFFSVNANLFFRSACITSVTLGVTVAGARLGSMTLAVNAVLMQFFTFFSFFMDGFAFSAEALTGRFKGAGDGMMFRKSVRYELLWGLGVAVVFTAFYAFGGTPVVALLTDEPSVREGAAGMIVWILALPLVSVWAFVFDGFYVGITDTRKMLWATLVATLAFFAITFLHIDGGRVSGGVVSNHMLWTAFLCYLGIRGGALAVLWRGSVRKLNM